MRRALATPPTVALVVLVFLVFLVGGCGSGSSEPTPPGSDETSDLRGTWVQTNGETRTWVLNQSDTQANGTTSYSQLLSPNVGTVSGTGRVSGTVSQRAYRFTETYQGVTIPSRPSATTCTLDADGQLAISGNTMRGSVRESVSCFGVQLAQVTRDLVMQRR